MKKNVQRIISVFLTALMLVVVVIPVHALPVPGTLYETTDFYNSIYTAFLKWKAAHPDSDDSEYSGYGGGAGRGGGFLGEGSGQFDKAAYDDYVETLPAPSYASDGSLLYTLPTLDYFYVGAYNGHQKWEGCPHTPSNISDNSGGTLYGSQKFFDCATGTIQIVPKSGLSGFYFDLSTYHFSGKAPVSGYYTLQAGPGVKCVFTQDKVQKEKIYNYSQGGSVFYSASADIVCGISSYPTPSGFASYAVFTCSHPVYKVAPFNSSGVADTYATTTRPTSITGGNYGIVGDNGQITKVEDNSTIINETNNTYYNPATGQTVPITGWSYDYSDRSYKVTLESGDTVTITYGDENITIQEGDTVYNVYYLIDGSGSETPVGPPAACEHTWTETSTISATCIMPGSKLLTCTKCQQTKTETIPALGHDWQLKQTVTTQYDGEGNLTQQGYTIFECSRCHEQYKSTDGTIPPGGGSGTDPGGEEGETTIGGLIEKLLSGVGSIVGGIIKGFLSLLTKAVEALAGLAELFTTFVGSLVELWGGFTSFLSAVFPFLPEEFVIIIELGLILMIAAAVFRKFIS